MHAYTSIRLSEYKRLATHGKYYGIESEVLAPAEAKVCFVGQNVPIAVQRRIYKRCRDTCMVDMGTRNTILISVSFRNCTR